jgi:hypothetical protein
MVTYGYPSTQQKPVLQSVDISEIEAALLHLLCPPVEISEIEVALLHLLCPPVEKSEIEEALLHHL